MLKTCPKCHQTFSEENFYCLSDGTPLNVVFDATEQATVVKPEEVTVIKQSPFVQPPPAERQGVSPIFAYLTIGLLILMAGGAVIGGIIIFQMKSKPEISSTVNGNTVNKVEVANKINVANTFSNYAEPTPDKERDLVDQQKADLQNQQAQLEKEKQKLAEDRKKLEVQKDNPVEKTYAPVAQPTARINFPRGSTQSTISGTVYTERSYVLGARSGQYLSASVSSGGCVVFSNGSTSMSYTTSSGDNRVSVTNKCGGQSSFSLTVSIR